MPEWAWTLFAPQLPTTKPRLQKQQLISVRNCILHKQQLKDKAGPGHTGPQQPGNVSTEVASAAVEQRDLIARTLLSAATTTNAPSFVGADGGSERRKDFVLLFPDDLLQKWVLA